MLTALGCQNFRDVNHGKNVQKMLHCMLLKAASYQDNAEQVQCCSSSDLLDVFLNIIWFLASNLASCKSSAQLSPPSVATIAEIRWARKKKLRKHRHPEGKRNRGGFANAPMFKDVQRITAINQKHRSWLWAMLQVFHICSDAVEVGGLMCSEQITCNEIGLASCQLATLILLTCLFSWPPPLWSKPAGYWKTIRHYIAIWTQVPCLW